MDFKDGIMRASSAAGDNKPKNAIEKNRFKNWISKSKNESTFVAMIWHELKKNKDPKFSPAKISFKPPVKLLSNGKEVNMTWSQQLTPTKWQFVGSMGETDKKCNTTSDWVVLCKDLSGDLVEDVDDTKNCWVDDKALQGKPKVFRCLGVRVLETVNGRKAGLSRMRIFVRELDD